jgi:serine phosphatase RsbU (regulator of sigma subunit)
VSLVTSSPEDPAAPTLAPLSSVPDALVVLDRSGRPSLVNEAAARLLSLGSPPEWQERYRSLRLLSLDGRPLGADVPGARALRGEEVRESEGCLETAQGLTRLSFSASPLRDDAGEIVGAIATFRDVTPIYRVQEELRAAVGAERHRAVQLHALNQLIMGVNSESDPGRLLEEVLRGAADLVGALSASVYLLERQSLRLQAFFSWAAAGEGAAGDRGRETKRLVRRAMAERRLLAYPQQSSQPRILAAPLASGGEVLGGIVLSGRRGGEPFGAQDEMFVSALASHVSVALINLRRLEREQELALYLQQHMLPSLPRIPGVEYHVEYQSATETALVGGDFYDVIPLPDGRVAAAVGDVCGRGLTAAGQSLLTRYILRAYAPFGLEAGDWLSLVNEGMQGQFDSGGFVTACLAILDPAHGRLELAVAGHPPPVCCRSSGSSRLAVEPGLPLCAMPGQRFSTSRLPLADGETLVLFTDGLFETRRGTELFGIARLDDLAASLYGSPLPAAARQLLDEASAWGGGSFADDLALILLRPRSDGDSRSRRVTPPRRPAYPPGAAAPSPGQS